MKIFKTSKLQRGMIFHVQDRDKGFVFVGRVRFYGLDFIQFDVLPMYEAPSCKTRGIYTLNIGSSFSLYGVKWDDKRNGYAYDELSITSEYLVIDDDVDKDKDQHTKFDIKKAEDLLYTGKFHVQDHDNKFQFYGVFKSVKPDELTFHISGPTVGNTHTRGTYRFPAGSHFTIYTLRLNADKTEWIYSPGPGHTIDWKDITENYDNDDKNNDNVKEAKDMNLDFWKDCVIKDDAWVVNDQIKVGDTIDRIKTDAIDIKGHMTIGSTSYGMLSVEFDYGDKDTDSIQIKITPDMRVFNPDSPDNPGILVQQQKCKFNPELRVGKLYWIANADLEFQYVMHVRSITDKSIDVDLISTINGLDNTSRLDITGKSFDITELLEYKFQEV